jgi:predicted N-formylglutamate amidohydrolase
MKCIISCEHASNRVPPRFGYLFKGREKVLSSHQAYDHGTANLAGRLAGRLKSSVYLGTVTRLLIDLNRSPSNKKSLYSSYSRKLEQNERELLLNKYYSPYREKVAGRIGGIIAQGKPVLHISVHSFAPVKSGKVRKADIGLLFDPGRKFEKDISGFLVEFLQKNIASLRVRRNYPYLGKTDGFTSFLRKKYSGKLYAGIEIEINQALLSADVNKKKKVEDSLSEGIRNILKLQDFSKLRHMSRVWRAVDGY